MVEYACNHPCNILYPSGGKGFPKSSTNPGPAIAPGKVIIRILLPPREVALRYSTRAFGKLPGKDTIYGFACEQLFGHKPNPQGGWTRPKPHAAVHAHLIYPKHRQDASSCKTRGLCTPGKPSIEARCAHHVAESGPNFESMYLSRNCAPWPDFLRKRKPEARALRRCQPQRVKTVRGLDIVSQNLKCQNAHLSHCRISYIVTHRR